MPRGDLRGERNELVDGRRRLDHLRLGRAAAAHRDHDHVTVAGEQPREMSGDRGLPDALAGADHGDRGQLERLEDRRVEAEVGTDVRQAGRERARGPAKALDRPEHRLVRQVDDQLGGTEVVDERHAVVGTAAKLLGPADEDRAHPLVRQLGQRIAHDRRVVLPVDQRDGPHRLVVTSRSIRPVYFSYSPVAVSNWMIRSCPWNG